MNLLDLAMKAQRLAELIEIRKTNEIEENSLRTFFKGLLAPTDSLTAGKWLIITSEKTRTDLDKKALTSWFGEALRRYERKTTYSILEVKPYSQE